MISRRFHFALTSNSLQLSEMPEGVNVHFTLNSLSIHFDVTSVTLRCQFEFTFGTLRCRFDFTSVSLRSHLGLTSLLRLHKRKMESVLAHKGKGKARQAEREKGEGEPPLLRSDPTRQTDHARMQEQTKRNDFSVGLTRQLPIDNWL